MVTITVRQINSLRALKCKIDTTAPFSGVRVTAAQFAALQAAYNDAKRDGREITAEMRASATMLGLK